MRRPGIILTAYEVAPTGGMARAAFELTQRLLDRDVRVTVVARACKLPPDPNLRWVRVPVPARPASIKEPLFFLVGAIALFRAGDGIRITEGPVVCNRVDMIRVHFCHRGFSKWPTSAQRTHEGLHYRVNALVTSALARLWERWCIRPRRVRKLVAVSSGVARELRTHFPAVGRQIEVVPNGVNANTFRPSAEWRGRIRQELGIADEVELALFVGGDWKRKGLRFVIEAVGATDNWHLMVLGAGDALTYGQLAERSGADGRVHFLGRVQEPAPYYAAADAFVFPTLYEAFSLVTLEAAAAGLPLLVTAVSGAEDIVREGENGWFIDRDTATIVPHLRALSEQPGLRDRLGEAARASVEPFSWDRVADEHQRLFGELAASSPGQA